jgi:Mrp family chromosome partitioning ATPase
VLIDADLHRPSMHGYFGVAPSPGLSDYLRAVADVDEISWPTMLPKLMLVPAGTPAHDAMELLTSQRMSELLRLMKEEDPRRLIVVDAAPLMQATEVATLARYVDGVLLVVTENLSRVSVVQKAAHLIAKEQMLGVVYNRSSSKAVEAPYGSYYYGPSGSYVRDTLAANTDGKQS